tara:strand:+ start:10910 stop:11488 length:579 start_codon:yes stop_codon:yes gene_type:complete
MPDAIVVGNGGHAISIIDILFELNYRILGTIKPIDGENNTICGIDTIGTDLDLPKLRKKIDFAFNGIGQIKDHLPRKNVYEKLLTLDFKIPPLISPSANISKHVNIGLGTSVHAQSFINAQTFIGDNCIINSGSIIEHGCIIEKNTHISTGVILNGNVKIGKNCFIGSGSILYQDSEVLDNVIIPAGSIIKN